MKTLIFWLQRNAKMLRSRWLQQSYVGPTLVLKGMKQESETSMTNPHTLQHWVLTWPLHLRAFRLTQSNWGKVKAPHGQGHFKKIKVTQEKLKQEKIDPHGHGHFSKVQEKYEKWTIHCAQWDIQSKKKNSKCHFPMVQEIYEISTIHCAQWDTRHKKKC